MNRPPEAFIRVPHQQLHGFVSAAAQKVGLPKGKAEFKRQMDLYVQQVRQLQPLPGFDQSYVPGGIEAARERQYRREGVPVGKRHQKHLEKLAEELAIPAPWR